jgi:hypothetical protein|tara:strand:+ start:49 stop:1053 length:1005 start_codon:yes stop_codon:yes gene_type:complete
MALFTRSFIERINDIEQGIEDINLNKDLQFKFQSKVKQIEDYDIECIRVLKRLSRAGHIPEKHKRALINQLVFLLRRLEKPGIDKSGKLEEIRTEIETIIMEELTAERIGIELNKPIYHGTGIAGIKSFKEGMEEFDYLGMETLGNGIYCTDSKKMGINYAFYRYNKYNENKGLARKYGDKIKATLYTIKLRKGSNFIANFNDPRNIQAIYQDLRQFIEKKKTTIKVSYQKYKLDNFIAFLGNLIEHKIQFPDIRKLLEEGQEKLHIGKQTYNVCRFLQSVGYHGLRNIENGELDNAVYPWVPSMSYLLFNPDDIEIINEEHYGLVKDRVVRVK